MLNSLGYNTKAHTTLHTRNPHLRAELLQDKQKVKFHVECKAHHEGPIGLREVERFCHRVAVAKENSEVDSGMLISNSGFSQEAVSWVAKNCSFVQLKSYKELISFNARHKKLLRKFN
jgi:hypothetical protein